MDTKQILTLNKRQSIVQRIDAMKASFSANKIKDKLSRYHYFGYSSQILINKLISKIPSKTVDKNSAIAVVNDFGLEVISQLQLLGYTNLILLCTESDDKLYNIIKYMVEKEFNFTRIERLQDMRIDDKFDLVIANPPYEIGNAVITETMKHCNEAVVLMPHSDYLAGCLYKNAVMDNIAYLSVKQSQEYFDASVPALTIALLNSNIKNNVDNFTWKLKNLDQTISLIYQYNRKHEDCCDARSHFLAHSNLHVKDNLSKSSFDPNCFDLYTQADYETSIVFGMYYIENGLHKTDSDATDNFWNYKLPYYKDFQKWVIDNNKKPDLHKAQFRTKIEKHNCVAWIYNGYLYSLILNKLNEQGASGTIDYIKYITIPHIDWSRTDVEYTDEYVLEQMGLKWNENKDGVEKL